jgi:hypothetical protein
MIADFSHSLQFITSQWTEVKGPESLSHLLQVFRPGHANIYCWMGQNESVAVTGCWCGFTRWHVFFLKKLTPSRCSVTDYIWTVIAFQVGERLRFCPAVYGAVANVEDVKDVFFGQLWE